MRNPFEEIEGLEEILKREQEEEDRRRNVYRPQEDVDIGAEFMMTRQ